MSLNISNFAHQIQSKYGGIAPANLFIVNFYMNESATTAGILPSRDFSLLCTDVNLPGLSIGVDDQTRRYGTGVIEKMPYGVFFGDLQISFLVDAGGKIMKAFHSWMHNITGFASDNKDEQYEVAYKDTYTCRMEIVVLDIQNNGVITYVIEEAFPLFLPDTQVSWGQTDSLMLLHTTMSYRNWYTDKNQAIDTNSALTTAIRNLTRLNISDPLSLLRSANPNQIVSTISRISDFF